MDESLSTEEVLLLVVLGVGLFWILPSLLCLRIAEKAGRSRWWGLLGFVPVNIFIIWAFAFFAEWPGIDNKEIDSFDGENPFPQEEASMDN